MEQDELIMYIIVNEELNMSAGKIAGQVSHAVTSFMMDAMFYDYGGRAEFNELEQDSLERVHAWYDIHNQKKIIVKAKQSVLEESQKLQNCYWVIRDLGLTEIKPNSLTAVCLGIDTRERFYNRIPKLKRLRLL